MPELPEVQTVINYLNTKVLNKKITRVKVFKSKMIKNCSVNDFVFFLEGEIFERIERVGKYLIFHLTHHKILCAHLRMEGKFHYQKNDESYDKKHVHMIIDFGDYQLRYHDTRQFGTFHIFNEENYMESKILQKLAFDPLNSKCDGKYIKSQIGSVNRAIKTAILDQTKISGIGNIYADEILFACKLYPMAIAANCKPRDFDCIAIEAERILRASIAKNGTTINSFHFSKWQIGSFQEFLEVHKRVNLPCKVCGTEIVKTKVNGRGTYYCPKCQKRGK